MKVSKSPPRVVRPVRQNGRYDCGIACLAMLIDASYEAVITAVAEHPKVRLHGGLTNQSVIALARHFGVVLEPRRRKPEATNAILKVSQDKAKLGHFLYVLGDTAYDPADGNSLPLDAWLSAYKARTGYYLQRVTP